MVSTLGVLSWCPWVLVPGWDYASRGLKPTERNMTNYSSMKLEFLALKWAMTGYDLKCSSRYISPGIATTGCCGESSDPGYCFSFPLLLSDAAERRQASKEFLVLFKQWDRLVEQGGVLYRRVTIPREDAKCSS